MAAVMRSSLRTTVCRPVMSVRMVARPIRVARAVQILRATPEKKNVVETAISEAEEACKDGSTGECAAAWDTVEEISAASSHKRDATPAVDPMDQFCEGDPSADECRVYEA